MKFVALQPVLMPRGAVVRLSKDQAARTAALVAPADKKGWSVVKSPFHFKAGEAFEYEGDLPKALADLVEDAAPAAPAAAEKAPLPASQG